ncbi:hypothetical protein PALB_17760 [Pseudoalteromonas luteoviolacea B = ATCC 29581]|nr:hypothetical protein PALB_17760 [Pseudoalteromonas luteoviolacea B = ATCC 29581]
MNDDFTDAVYSVIGAIPSGNVASYGYVAKLAGFSKHARAVGYLLKHLPKDSSLPWYRVVNSKRELSFEPGSTNYTRQKNRLMAEGVEFDGLKINKQNYLG